MGRLKTALKLSAIGLGALTAHCQAGDAALSKTPKQPNIVIIMTDQQFADGMSCVMGREYLSTPNMDSLAQNGVRFTRAYSPNPLCIPMRTSMFTGHYPHSTGVLTNQSPKLRAGDFVFLGKLFKNAGYETAYFGKWHVSFDSKKKDVHGFDTFEEKESQLDARRAAEFLRQEHERPFLMVASFLGPHEICEWSRRQELPGEALGEPPPSNKRPPMRANSAPPNGETDILTHMRKSYQAHRLFPVGGYTEDDWRRLIWGYYRLIERVDSCVGKVLEALRESGREEDTLVLFLSDHGDCHGAHGWNQKTVFYDESARVPFMLSWKGKTPQATCDVLLNTGIDVLPTLCDFAGIAAPATLPGKSLKAHALGEDPSWKRDYVVSENHMVQCEPVEGRHLTPHGRMVRSARYKYCLYSEGTRRESLVDMEKDPGEMTNQAANPQFRDILQRHRAYLREHAELHGDKRALEMLAEADRRLEDDAPESSAAKKMATRAGR